MRYLLPVIIVLALVDGALHFAIDAFVNKTFTNLPYGPLFVALPIGYLILIAALLRTREASIATQRLVLIVFAVYTVIPLIGYFYLTGGKYNPFQLATIAKPVEVVLIGACVVSIAMLGRRNYQRLATASGYGRR
jgi:hypothetical protein